MTVRECISNNNTNNYYIMKDSNILESFYQCYYTAYKRNLMEDEGKSFEIEQDKIFKDKINLIIHI